MDLGEIDSLLEDIGEMRDIIKDMELEISSEYEWNEDQKDEEDEEYSESVEDELKEYQKKFRKYAESLRKELRNLYEPKENGNNEIVYIEKKGEKEGIKTPWERGHKLGCGCPGCTKYREFYAIRLETANRNSDLRFPDLRFASKKSEAKREYKESEARPCGGKFHHFFHGNKAEFKKLFGNYLKKLNLNLAGY